LYNDDRVRRVKNSRPVGFRGKYAPKYDRDDEGRGENRLVAMAQTPAAVEEVNLQLSSATIKDPATAEDQKFQS
jgi:hypothetical protein